MVSWKTVSNFCFVVFSAAVLLNYLIQRTEYMETYFDYKMNLCQTDAEKIQQLENWDQNSKFDPPPFRSQEAWDTFWSMYRLKAFHNYQHLFKNGYTPHHLRHNRIVLTPGGKYIEFD